MSKALPEEPMMKVYVCSPFRPVSKDPKRAEKVLARNIRRAKFACELLTKLGYLPIAPHLYFPQFLNDNNPEERENGMMLGRELLCGCDELWVFGRHISEGMEAEIRQAKASDIPVRYCDEPEKAVMKMLDICEELTEKFMGFTKDGLAGLAESISKKAGIPTCLVMRIFDVIFEAMAEEIAEKGGGEINGKNE